MASVSSTSGLYANLYKPAATTTKTKTTDEDTSTAAASKAAEDTEITKEDVAKLISSNQSSYADGLFSGFSKANPTSGGAGDLLSSLTSSFQTLDLMRSGAYHKLLKSYYAAQNGESKATVEAKRTALDTVKRSSSDLRSAAAALYDPSLYEKKTDSADKSASADGYDRKGILAAAKSFVSAYNQTLDDASEVDSATVLQKGVSMVGMTDVVADQLKEIGITVGSDNSLSINETAFNAADISTVKSLFSGSGSYAARIGQKAAMMSENASMASYNANGTYNYNSVASGLLNTEA